MLFGCQKTPPLKSEEKPAFQPPTATEVFNLSSKCAELGEKIMEGNAIGIALAQSQISHFDPKTNRCYVELDVHMADLSKFDDDNGRYLYDGQTGEMLAWSRSTRGKKTGFVVGPGAGGFDAANTKIDDLMADDRKQ